MRNANWKIQYVTYHPPEAIGRPRRVEPFPAFSQLNVSTLRYVNARRKPDVRNISAVDTPSYSKMSVKIPHHRDRPLQLQENVSRQDGTMHPVKTHMLNTLKKIRSLSGSFYESKTFVRRT
jgi:hypothetical protein